MTKEQFLAFSLPYDVKAIDKFKCIWTIHPYKDALDTLRDNEHLSYENFIKEEGHKLVLRPLSDLTKEIEHEGEKFVPSFTLFPTDEFEEYFGMPTHSDYAKTFISEPKSRCLNILDWLKIIEWHFDICGLIEKGEAIDVNTLDKNPYS